MILLRSRDNGGSDSVTWGPARGKPPVAAYACMCLYVRTVFTFSERVYLAHLGSNGQRM